MIIVSKGGKMIIEFDNKQNKKKPITINNKDVKCPFCNIEMVDKIYDSNGPYKWVENKYQSLKDADMTLIIETEKCGTDLGDYTDDYASELLKFALEKYELMKQTNKYQSVILFKNYGYLSGGSLEHPHMQIVGLKEHNVMQEISIDNCEGYLVFDEEVKMTLSKEPVTNFVEYNFHFKNSQIDYLAVYLQRLVKSQLQQNSFPNYSYNLFLYEINGNKVLKFTPRYPVSPYYIGYKLKQVLTHEEMSEIVTKVRKAILEK